MLKLECSHCKAALSRTKSQLSVIAKKGIKDIFCGVDCRNKFRIRKVSSVCRQCSKVFDKFPSQQRSDKQHDFCGSSCAATFNNRHRTIGNRSSKLELWLQSRLPEVFPGLEFQFNDKTAIEGELDIYVPSLKLGIEIQGPTHFFPIYGQDILENTQKNDDYKRQMCKKNGVKLVELDVSDMINMKSYKFSKYVEQTFEVIKAHIETSSI